MKTKKSKLAQLGDYLSISHTLKTMREVEGHRNSSNTRFVSDLKAQLGLRLTAQIAAYGTALSIASILLMPAANAADLQAEKNQYIAATMDTLEKEGRDPTNAYIEPFVNLANNQAVVQVQEPGYDNDSFICDPLGCLNRKDQPPAIITQQYTQAEQEAIATDRFEHN